MVINFRSVQLKNFNVIILFSITTMSSSEKKRKPDNTEIKPGRKPEGYLGQCEVCGLMGYALQPCKQCESKTVEIIVDHSDIDSHFLGFRGTDYKVCEICDVFTICDNAGKMKNKDDEEENKNCLKCMKNGRTNRMVQPERYHTIRLKLQKCFPRCVQVPYNKCKECWDTAEYFERQLPTTIMMASSVLQVSRAYDALVQIGFKVSFD